MNLTVSRISTFAAALAVSFACGHLPAQEATSTTPLGVVSHLNLISNHSEDISSLEAWKQTYIKDGMSDQEKAIAIFNTIVKYRHQANPPREFLSSEMSGGHIHDPLKTAHVYGYSQCCCTSANVQGLGRYLGMPTRGRPITVHSVAEVFYDDSWHLIDPSVMNYHVKEDGKLASVDEIHEAVYSWLCENPQYLEGEIGDRDKKLRQFARDGGWKKGPELLANSDNFYGEHGINTAGWHGWSSTMIEYSKVEPPDEFWAQMGYQLNVQLRPGEKITRNFNSRGIDYTNNISLTYYDQLLHRKLLGIQTDLGDRAPGRIGDGTIEWKVPFNVETLKSVALQVENVGPVKNGLGAADPSKPAVIVLRFPSSYVYVKGIAMIDTNRGQGQVAVSFSDNNGLDWKPLYSQERGGGYTINLTPVIQKRYDYRLKFEITGEGTSLNAVHTINDFQCSQAALPVITEGENTLTFRAGPQEGTVTLEGATNIEQAQKHQQLTIADFHPVLSGVDEQLRMTSSIGHATFNVATPGEMTRLRISVGWQARGAEDGWQTQVSFDNGRTFVPVPNGQLQGGSSGESRYLIVSDVPSGTRAAQVRFLGKQAESNRIYDLRIDADYREPAGGFKPVKITYVWEEDGLPKGHAHVASRTEDTWTITCGTGAVVRSFTMELAE